MRKLTWILGLLVLVPGCAHRTEGAADAAATGGQPGLVDAGPQPGDAGGMPSLEDAGLGAARGPLERMLRADAGLEGPPDAGAGGLADAGAGPGGGRAQAGGEEACVDRWLEAHGLDSYGHPKGTMYAGGTPLFDERTGESTDRLVYVYTRQPAARAACAPGKKAPAPRGPAGQ